MVDGCAANFKPCGPVQWGLGRYATPARFPGGRRFTAATAARRAVGGGGAVPPPRARSSDEPCSRRDGTGGRRRRQGCGMVGGRYSRGGRRRRDGGWWRWGWRVGVGGTGRQRRWHWRLDVGGACRQGRWRQRLAVDGGCRRRRWLEFGQRRGQRCLGGGTAPRLHNRGRSGRQFCCAAAIAAWPSAGGSRPSPAIHGGSPAGWWSTGDDI